MQEGTFLLTDVKGYPQVYLLTENRFAHRMAVILCIVMRLLLLFCFIRTGK